MQQKRVAEDNTSSLSQKILVEMHMQDSKYYLNIKWLLRNKTQNIVMIIKTGHHRKCLNMSWQLELKVPVFFITTL